MADIHGSPGDPGLQMPQNSTSSGSAPVPYAGADQSPEPPLYAPDLGPVAPADGYVLHGVTNLGTTQAGGAHDIANAANMGISGTADAPYYPGPLAPVNAMGDPDAGGRDTVAGTVADAVANATGRWQEQQGNAHAGGRIGDTMTLPVSPLDPGVGSTGTTDPAGAFYDPPRGGSPETFANTGNEPG